MDHTETAASTSSLELHGGLSPRVPAFVRIPTFVRHTAPGPTRSENLRDRILAARAAN
jgi:hypothetical protein